MFKMLPINLLLIELNIVVVRCVLAERENIVKDVCNAQERYSDVFMNMLMLYGAEFNLHRKSVISSVWNLFQSTIDWT